MTVTITTVEVDDVPPKIPESKTATKVIKKRWEDIPESKRAEYLRMHARYEKNHGSTEAAKRLNRLADDLDNTYTDL